MTPREVAKVKARIAKAQRRVKAGYAAKGESEADRAARLAALLPPEREGS